MNAPTAKDIIRPALILLAHDNERLAGNQGCLAKALDDAYVAAQLVSPMVQLSAKLWAPELEHSVVGKNIFARHWNNGKTISDCLDVDPDLCFCGVPKDISGDSVLSDFIVFAAQIVVGRFQRDDALSVSAFDYVVSESRVILKNCGFEPTAISAANLEDMLTQISNFPDIDGQTTFKEKAAWAEADGWKLHAIATRRSLNKLKYDNIW